MDASAYLRNQGWRGHGHSLDHTDRGIKKPLLISQKVDVLGVGLNKHTAVSDQWWLRAFDQGLRSLGTGEETTLARVQKLGVNRGGLYGRFVKGEKIAGSIDQSLLPTPEDSEGSSTNTQRESEDEPKIKMAADAQSNQRDAPVSTMEGTDRKRKRGESYDEKRTRRKLEKGEKAKTNAEARLEREGGPDPEKEEERRRTKEINDKANELVLECQRRGIIPAGPNEIRKGLIPTGANATMQGQPSEELQKIFDFADINLEATLKGSRSKSLKGQKIARERAKHEVKRAVKAYLMGEKLPYKMTLEEKKVRKEAKRVTSMRKEAEAAKKQVELLATRTERTEKKREKRARKAAINAVMAEDEAAGKTDEAPAANSFDDGADEIKLGLNSSGRVKKIPGVGRVDRYPSKAEKKARKLKAQEVEANMSDTEVQARIEAAKAQKASQENGDVPVKGDTLTPPTAKEEIPPEKLAEYQKRAEQKGMSLVEYITRRGMKNAAKKAEKLGTTAEFEAAEKPALDNSIGGVAVGAPSPDEGLGFVVDTTGDSKLASTTASGIKVVVKTTTDGKGPTDFSNQAIEAMTKRWPITIFDEEGNQLFNWDQNSPIPLDPRIWEGQVVKNLPKAVRAARRNWMAEKRLEKKARKAGGTALPPKKPKGQRKVEAREAFVRSIIFESRKALRNGQGSTLATIDGIENVPLIKIESQEGQKASKSEVSLARTVARRVQRNVKRQEKAEKGKGKGWKKQQKIDADRAKSSLTGR